MHAPDLALAPPSSPLQGSGEGKGGGASPSHSPEVLEVTGRLTTPGVIHHADDSV